MYNLLLDVAAMPTYYEPIVDDYAVASTVVGATVFAGIACLIIAILVVLAAAVVIIVLILNKKKKKEKEMLQQNAMSEDLNEEKL